MTAKRQSEVTWITVKDSMVHLDWEELGDVLGLPYDFTITGNVLELQLLHAEAIVEFIPGHCRLINSKPACCEHIMPLYCDKQPFIPSFIAFNRCQGNIRNRACRL